MIGLCLCALLLALTGCGKKATGPNPAGGASRIPGAAPVSNQMAPNGSTVAPPPEAGGRAAAPVDPSAEPSPAQLKQKAAQDPTAEVAPTDGAPGNQ